MGFAVCFTKGKIMYKMLTGDAAVSILIAAATSIFVIAFFYFFVSVVAACVAYIGPVWTGLIFAVPSLITILYGLLAEKRRGYEDANF